MPAPELDSKLVSGLTSAKSKKCFFVMLYKGASVVHLIVSPVQIKENEYNEIKSKLGAVVVRGSCQTENGEMHFKVAEDAPVTDQKLKEFINHHTKLSIKLRFEVTQAAGEIGKTAGGTDSPELSGQETESEQTVEDQGKSESELAAATFTARIKALKPGIDRIISAATSVTEAVKTRFTEIASLAGKKQYVDAVAALQDFEVLLKQGLVELAQKKQEAEKPVVVKTDDVKPEEVKPEDDAVKQPAPTPQSNAAHDFAERLKAIRPDMEKALVDGGSAAEQLKSLSKEMSTAARQGKFDAATQFLEKIASLLSQTSGPRPQVPKGLVRYRKSLLKYRDARRIVSGQLQTLEKEIGNQDPDEIDTAEEVVAWLEDTFESLDTTIDRAISTAEDLREPVNQQTKTEIGNFIKELETDPMVLHVDQNPYAKVTIKETLVAALTEIQKTMV